jgi:hypothetical protein
MLALTPTVMTFETITSAAFMTVTPISYHHVRNIIATAIPNETAPSKATPVHKIFVCHPVVSAKVPIARLPYCSAIANSGVLERARTRLHADRMSTISIQQNSLRPL